MLAACQHIVTIPMARPDVLVEKHTGKRIAFTTSVMLKITTHNEERIVRFEVEGRLTFESIEVLERCWRNARELSASPEIQVEFTDVTFVDEPAKKLLKTMANGGVKLIARDIHVKAILENIRQACREEEEL